MNEIIVTTKTTEIIAGFKNVELKETTTNAIAQALSIENSRKNIAVALAKVYNNGFWSEDFESFDKYAETIYGLNRTTVSRLRRISDRFITNVNSPLDGVYSINQLAEILPLEDDEILNGNFSPDMGITDIRKEVQRIKALRLEIDETEETEETETEETETKNKTEKAVKLERTFENKKELSLWVQEMFKAQANIKNIKITYEF